MKKLTLFVVLALLFVMSMGVQAQSTRSYLVIANGNNLPRGLERQIAAAGGTITRTLPQIGIVVVESANPNFSSRISGVMAVVPNLTLNWLPGEDVQLVDNTGFPPNSGDDDIRFDLQWGHNAVGAQAAWDAGQTGEGVRVAVLDSGIDAEHPDLAPNLNSTLSASFVPGEDWNIRPGVFFNHGTHVAGTIGAADNALGTIGVAPDVELVAVKVLSEYTGSGSFDGVIAGIVYAADIDADIINMSLGATLRRSGEPNLAVDPYTARDVSSLSVAMSRATTYAYQNGTLVIVSEGNSAIDKDHTADWITLPADATNAVSISATAPFGWATSGWDGTYNTLSHYSNFGRSATEFGAPGGDWDYAFTDATTNCTVGGLTRPCYVFDYVFSTSSQGYSWASGTSMAAPHASGVAAIIIGETGGTLSPSQVVAEMQRRAVGQGNSASVGAGVVHTGY